MIVCLCRSVSDRKITELIESGVDNFGSLQNLCGVGSGCGKCVRFVCDLIEERRGLLSNKGCGRTTQQGHTAKECKYGGCLK